MNIIQLDENKKDEWNSFVVANGGSFLQAYEWGDLRASLHNKIWRFVVEEDGIWLGVLFVYKEDVRLGQSEMLGYHGPVLNIELSREKRFEVFSLFVTKLDGVAKQEKIMGLQLAPMSKDTSWCRDLADKGFVKAKEDSQPRHTLILDIRGEEDELLKQMHTKTRYNIRLAKKKGVEIEVDNSKFKEFWELTKKTRERQNITTFSYHYFEKLLEIPFVKLYLAKKDGKYIGANIMVFWGDIVTYLYGATDYEFRNVMAPYLLQWQAIQDAKDEHKWFYDFWGTSPKDAKCRETNWSGFTRFKMGFSPNGELTEYLGDYEKLYLPVRLGLYRFLRKIYK